MKQRSTIRPRTDHAAAWTMAVEQPGIALYGTPALPREWVGREEILQGLNDDWLNTQCRMAAITGTMGLGKSSLVRLWVSELPADEEGDLPPPQGIFWWNFHERNNVDEFFWAVLSYLSGNRIDLRRSPSNNVRVQVLAAMLSKARYLFILDGLDVLQYQEGTRQGQFISPNMREFFDYVTALEHSSFFVVTSRYELPAIERATSHYRLEPLMLEEGYAVAQQMKLLGGGRQGKSEREGQESGQEQDDSASVNASVNADNETVNVGGHPDTTADNTHDIPEYKGQYGGQHGGQHDEQADEQADEQTDEYIDGLVMACEGNPSVLSLVGTYILGHLSQNPGPLSDAIFPTIPPSPTGISVTSDHSKGVPARPVVEHLLRGYHRVLSPEEQTVLLIVSAFRRPVSEAAIFYVCHAHQGEQWGVAQEEPCYANLALLGAEGLQAVIARLITRRLLHYNQEENLITIAPAIRPYYVGYLYGDSLVLSLPALAAPQIHELHRRIKDYYLAVAGQISSHPTLGELIPLIEGFYHAYRAREYNEAWTIYWERIAQHHTCVLANQLGAHETALDLLIDFFPDQDTSQEPLVAESEHQQHILDGMASCLYHLGRLQEAITYYERSNIITLHAVSHYEENDAISLKANEWHDANLRFFRLIELHIYLGELNVAASIAKRALRFARRVGNRSDELMALSYQAYIAFLRGHQTMSEATFYWAEVVERHLNPYVSTLYSIRGVWFADYLRSVGKNELAQRVTEANMKLCQRNYWRDELSRCHRLLGELEADAGNDEEAERNFNEAVEIAYNIPHGQPTLIEGLIARARWATRDIVAQMGMQSPANASQARQTGQSQGRSSSQESIQERRRRTRLAVEQLRAANDAEARAKQGSEQAGTAESDQNQPETQETPEPGEQGGQQGSQRPKRPSSGLSGLSGSPWQNNERVWVAGSSYSRRRLFVAPAGIRGGAVGGRVGAARGEEKERDERGAGGSGPVDRSPNMPWLDKRTKRALQGLSSQQPVPASVQSAQRDLEEALNYAVAGGYLLYEKEIRRLLAMCVQAQHTPPRNGTHLQEWR